MDKDLPFLPKNSLSHTEKGRFCNGVFKQGCVRGREKGNGTYRSTRFLGHRCPTNSSGLSLLRKFYSERGRSNLCHPSSPSPAPTRTSWTHTRLPPVLGSPSTPIKCRSVVDTRDDRGTILPHLTHTPRNQNSPKKKLHFKCVVF